MEAKHIETDFTFTANESFYYSLRSIEEIEDIGIKSQASEIYDMITNHFGNNLVVRKALEKVGSSESIEKIFEYIEEQIFRSTSMILFPGSLVIVYPYVKTHRATKKMQCHVPPCAVLPGKSYSAHRPLFFDLTNNKAYVLDKTLITEEYHYDFFPDNILDFESMVGYLENSSVTEVIIPGCNSSYGDLAVEYGDQFHLTLLDRKHKKSQKK